MPKTTIIMKSFIEDYLQNPAQAIAAARQTVDTESWYENIDEDMIYAQISSPEFRLYEAMIFASVADSSPTRAQVSA
jgi:GTP-binding protein EngB required for normal cell division